MTKEKATIIVKEFCSHETGDQVTDLLSLGKFLLTVKAVSINCYQSIYQAETLTFRVQSEYCEEWATLIEWEKVEHTNDYTYYRIGNLMVVVETPY